MTTPGTTTPTTIGPDFVSFQVRDLEASAAFYSDTVGLSRAESPNDAAVIFTSGPEEPVFAVRQPFPGVDLDAASPAPGYGIGVWFHSDDPAATHRRVTESGATVLQEPFDGPFGTQFSFLDPDGYTVTVHGDAG